MSQSLLAQSPTLAWVDGAPDQSHNLSNRAYQYGDGLFETIRKSGARTPLLNKHLARLARGCVRLDIPLSEAVLSSEINRFIAQISNRSGVIKVIISRCSQGRGYGAAQAPESTRTLLFFPGLPETLPGQQGIKVGIASFRLARQSALAGMKHLNRLEQVMASKALRRPLYQELLMLDTSGELIEALSSNVFLVKDGNLQTPILDHAGVEGVMRETLIADVCPRLKIAVREARLTVQDLMGADEVFLCNSVVGVQPVTAIDVKSYLVGPVTQSIQHELANLGY